MILKKRKSISGIHWYGMSFNSNSYGRSYLGVQVFIRIGTTGCINENLRKPEILGGIITGTVRGDGTTDMYVPKS